MSSKKNRPGGVFHPSMRHGIAWVFTALMAASICTAEDAAEPSEVGDIRFVRQAAGMDDVAPATFPHWIHRMAYACYACHDAPFKMKAGANEVTMDQIQAGQSCGACHNGKVAFESNLTTCNRCHR
jgi:c(7)-type cytochrome triheme protein